MSSVVTKGEAVSKRDYFINTALSVNNIFIEENITLTFSNYKKTISEYISSDESDILTLENLIVDLNLWFQYFSDLEGLVQTLYLKKQNMKSYVDAFPKTPKNQVKSTEISSQIIKIKMFLKQVKIQKKMFSNMSFCCLNMYNKAYENYSYRY